MTSRCTTPTILVVEDNPASRLPLARLLRSEGYETLCAADGDKALELLDFAKTHLILLDLMMPVVDGLQFLRVLRQNPQWADVPVIVMTGQPAEDESVGQARKLGAKDCFVKTRYTPEQLLTSIRRNVAA